MREDLVNTVMSLRLFKVHRLQSRNTYGDVKGSDADHVSPAHARLAEENDRVSNGSFSNKGPELLSSICSPSSFLIPREGKSDRDGVRQMSKDVEEDRTRDARRQAQE